MYPLSPDEAGKILNFTFGCIDSGCTKYALATDVAVLAAFYNICSSFSCLYKMTEPPLKTCLQPKAASEDVSIIVTSPAFPCVGIAGVS